MQAYYRAGSVQADERRQLLQDSCLADRLFSYHADDGATTFSCLFPVGCKHAQNVGTSDNVHPTRVRDIADFFGNASSEDPGGKREDFVRLPDVQRVVTKQLYCSL